MMADNKILRKLFHLYFLFSRPMTLGVRVIVENENGEVLLVRHTYVEGWYLPGGGVESKDTIAQTAIKELREEVGFEALSEPKLLNIYKNTSASNRDHVALFKIEDWRIAEPFKPNNEIAEMEFFAIDDLPETITAGNLKRIQEYYQNHPVSHYW